MFHDKPCFDSISVRAGGDDGQPTTWYAKILAIFKVTLKNKPHSLVYVQWYNATNQVHPFPGLRLLPPDDGRNFMVLDVTSLVDIVFVAPNFRLGGDSHFNINPWSKAYNTKKMSLPLPLLFPHLERTSLFVSCVCVGRLYRWDGVAEMGAGSEEESDSDYDSVLGPGVVEQQVTESDTDDAGDDEDDMEVDGDND